MRSFMGFQAKRELLLQIGARYSEASGRDRATILNEFVLATGYNRKYAIRLLNSPSLPLPSFIKRNRTGKYKAVLEALAVAWAAANCICAKRLVPFLPELIPQLEHHGHLALSQETRALLLSISAATADRLLQTSRRARGVGGISTTKPGKLLKHQIPLRTFSDWQDARPGFFEVDLVAHCGTTVAGTFLWTLVMTDVATGWTECFALLHRSGKGVVLAIQCIQKVLPFPVLGIDVDNGSEFINDDLIEYCSVEKITFTRGRVHRKNDQCFVEQKNGAIVRQLVGYDRYDGLHAMRQLSELYRALRLYVNFFQPSMKLKSKSREGAKVHREYSLARTPLQRVFATSILNSEKQEKLDLLRKSLDPVALLRVLQSLQDAFWRHASTAPPTSSGSDTSPVVFDLEACLPTYETPQLEAAPSIQPRKYRRTKLARTPRTYRTRRDPFESVNAQLHEWFLASPETTAKELLGKLQVSKPNTFSGNLLRTLQRKLSKWRASTLLEFVSPRNQDHLEQPYVRGSTTLLQESEPIGEAT